MALPGKPTALPRPASAKASRSAPKADSDTARHSRGIVPTSEAWKAESERPFEEIDPDKNGLLSNGELLNALKRHGPTEKDASMLRSALDTDDDGEVSKGE